MKFRIEFENQKDYTLQLGDILTNDFSEICSVIADFKDGKPIKYFIRSIFAPRQICNLSADTLNELTDKANNHSYRFFSKDEYEIILKTIR